MISIAFLKTNNNFDRIIVMVHSFYINYFKTFSSYQKKLDCNELQPYGALIKKSFFILLLLFFLIFLKFRF